MPFLVNYTYLRKQKIIGKRCVWECEWVGVVTLKWTWHKPVVLLNTIDQEERFWSENDHHQQIVVLGRGGEKWISELIKGWMNRLIKGWI